jgi:ribose transport system substrate-binding protein
MKLGHAVLIAIAGSAALGVTSLRDAAEATKGDIGYVGFAQNATFLSSLSTAVGEAITTAGYTPRLAQADGDATKQASAVNTLVSSGVRGILIDPVDSHAIVPVIERASQSHVIVVPIDGSAAGGPLPVQVGTDNYGAGALACKVIGDRIAGKGTVLNLQGGLDNFIAQGRTKGFTDCMAAQYSGVTVISKSFNWSAEQCAQIAQSTLTTQQIDGVYAATAACLAPVHTVLRQIKRLKKAGVLGHVPFVTVDGTPEELDAVRSGYLTASISQPVTDIAKYGVSYLTRALAGEKISAGPTDHGTKLVVIDGTLRDLLPPIAVTQANVESPSLWANRRRHS